MAPFAMRLTLGPTTTKQVLAPLATELILDLNVPRAYAQAYTAIPGAVPQYPWASPSATVQRVWNAFPRCQGTFGYT